MPTTPTRDSRESRRLRELLERLDDELGSAAALDPKTRDMLRSIQDHTRQLLEREGEEVTPGHANLRDRLKAEVAGLESAHPDLAMAMARFIDTLSGLGI